MKVTRFKLRLDLNMIAELSKGLSVLGATACKTDQMEKEMEQVFVVTAE